MDYDYSELVDQAIQWGDRVLQEGWINESDSQTLKDADVNLADSLFIEKESRPLIVAFFGGTGVGKSSLINRLAGKDIARTGVERPTSREVTLYYHQSVELQQMPENLPIDKVKTAQHDDDSRRNIFWIDMPDMDSTEASNKQLVLDWLPHIDVLVYVVSPERYRDNKAWQLLMSEGGKHAWLFVLNQWDRGQPEQYDDFIKQLAKAGFDNPIIIKTICNDNYSGNQEDEFSQLEDTLKKLTNQHTIQHIENRGEQIRKNELKQKLESCLAKMGGEQVHQKLKDDWEKNWQDAYAVLSKGMSWPIQAMSAKYAEKETQLFSGLFKKKVEEPKLSVDVTLWDEWAQSRYEDELDKIILAADHYQLATVPFRNSLNPVREQASDKIESQTELSVRAALVNPGNLAQRILLKFFGFCSTVLPLAAMIWVAYQVSDSFYDSDVNHEAYLGTDFAIHSLLLISIAWLLPYFAKRQLKPSLQKVALKGLTEGVETGLATLEAEVVNVIDENQKLREQHVNAANLLIQQCNTSSSITDKTDNETLSRMLI
jgi:GTPase SAR1 family protein